MAQSGNTLAIACKELDQDLVLFYYGDLSGTDRSKIETHLTACPSCALYLKELGAILPITVQADEPQPAFWDNYSREMRRKLEEIDERKSWWQAVKTWFQPWTLPALATTAVVALALTLTFGKTVWRDREAPLDEEAFMEVLPMAENLEFFSTMEVLDAMDLLEYLGNNASGSA
jgi:anti-sigma factor RsiW